MHFHTTRSIHECIASLLIKPSEVSIITSETINLLFTQLSISIFWTSFFKIVTPFIFWLEAPIAQSSPRGERINESKISSNYNRINLIKLIKKDGIIGSFSDISCVCSFSE